MTGVLVFLMIVLIACSFPIFAALDRIAKAIEAQNVHYRIGEGEPEDERVHAIDCDMGEDCTCPQQQED